MNALTLSFTGSYIWYCSIVYLKNRLSLCHKNPYHILPIHGHVPKFNGLSSWWSISTSYVKWVFYLSTKKSWTNMITAIKPPHCLNGLLPFHVLPIFVRNLVGHLVDQSSYSTTRVLVILLRSLHLGCIGTYPWFPTKIDMIGERIHKKNMSNRLIYATKHLRMCWPDEWSAF